VTSVAFQGELGAYSEEAVHRFFAGEVEPVPRRSFADVGDAVASGRVDYGLLPIANTLAGSVVGSYDVLAGGDLEVVGEVVSPIHHCVLGVPGASLEGLAQVLSHPVALAQCQLFLQARPDLEAVAFYDTAGAAQQVAEAGSVTQAAIAGRGAAERYGLTVLATDVEDRHDNQTRFLAVARPDTPPPARVRPGGGAKTALLVETDNTPGALVQILLPFAGRQVNLSKLESRPAAHPWTYRFFMEVGGDAALAPVSEALDEVRERATRLHVLGSFPRWVEEDSHPARRET
jgi:prephenate dehydratase